MREGMNRCQLCDTPLQHEAEYCIACFRKMHHACPNCMLQSPDGRWRPKKRGKPPRPIDCSVCLNERWVLYHPVKGLLLTGKRSDGTSATPL